MTFASIFPGRSFMTASVLRSITQRKRVTLLRECYPPIRIVAIMGHGIDRISRTVAEA